MTRNIMYSTISNLLICALLPICTAQLSSDPDELLNWCLDSKFHKDKPGPEGDLFSQCTPWKERSCCTYNTTVGIHQTKMYNFNYNHCSQKKNMSDQCKTHFLQELCFFECSPNIGPWVVQVEMKTRKERFFEVPLCRKDCEAWFNACKEEYTCTDNWLRNFAWSKDGNKCLPGTECRTFQEVYETADNFCQKLWDGSWKVTDESEPCMRIWFNVTTGNPNEAVAKYKVEQIQKLVNSRKNDGSFFKTSILLELGTMAFLFIIML